MTPMYFFYRSWNGTRRAEYTRTFNCAPPIPPIIAFWIISTHQYINMNHYVLPIISLFAKDVRCCCFWRCKPFFLLPSSFFHPCIHPSMYDAPLFEKKRPFVNWYALLSPCVVLPSFLPSCLPPPLFPVLQTKIPCLSLFFKHVEHPLLFDHEHMDKDGLERNGWGGWVGKWMDACFRLSYKYANVNVNVNVNADANANAIRTSQFGFCLAPFHRTARFFFCLQFNKEDKMHCIIGMATNATKE